MGDAQGLARPTDAAALRLKGPQIACELASRYGTKVFYLAGNPRDAGESFEGLLGVKSQPWAEADLYEIVERARCV